MGYYDASRRGAWCPGQTPDALDFLRLPRTASGLEHLRKISPAAHVRVLDTTFFNAGDWQWLQDMGPAVGQDIVLAEYLAEPWRAMVRDRLRTTTIMKPFQPEQLIQALRPIWPALLCEEEA
jgi:hypothetical protein